MIIEKQCNFCKKTFETAIETADDACYNYAEGWSCPHCGQSQLEIPESADREIPEVETGTDDFKSPRDLFVEALEEKNFPTELLGDINDYSHYVSERTDRAIADVYTEAVGNIDKFIDYFKAWSDERRRSSITGNDLGAGDGQEEATQDTSDNEGQDPDDLEIRNNLRDQLVLLRHKEEDRYKNVTNALVNSGQLPGTSLSEWSTDQMHDVIDAINDKF